MHIQRKIFLLFVSLLILLFAAAYIQWGTVGLPALPPLAPPHLTAATKPHGFPAWLRITHYINFLFIILLIRSGLQILMDHPLPPEPNGFYQYNALQQLAYFGVVFVLAPLAILTGPSMSPALTSRFGWYPKLPGNRQIGRSLHFLVMCGFVVFILIHVASEPLP